jgi:hypothetical protein
MDARISWDIKVIHQATPTCNDQFISFIIQGSITGESLMSEERKMINAIISIILVSFLTLIAGCMDTPEQTPAEVNATAIAIALNDTEIKAALAYDGHYEILSTGPTTIWNNDGPLDVTGVEIDTQNDLYHVYVDVRNVSVVFFRAQPKRAPVPANGSVTTVSPTPAQSETAAIMPDITPVSPRGGRTLRNVLRGEPFTIEGTVPDRSITKVQIWTLNDTISSTILPVLPDGSFRFTLDAQQTAKLPRDYSNVLIVHYPAPPDHFGVTLDNAPGEVMGLKNGKPVRLFLLEDLPSSYPTTVVDYLEKEITQSDNGDSCEGYFLNGQDAWIAIDPIRTTRPGSLTVTGATNLPIGTPLSISVSTVNLHPTPKNYDWSHEIASGDAVVTEGTGGNNTFSGRVDTSLLNSGRYVVIVESADKTWQSDAVTTVDLIAQIPAQAENKNYIDWHRLSLPSLQVNENIVPVLQDGGWRIVSPGAGTRNSDLPYGSILYCTGDGICRVFDRKGTQFLAVYNSNEAHMMEVPNGAMVDSGGIGNVTFVELDGETILTRIDEYSWNDR